MSGRLTGREPAEEIIRYANEEVSVFDVLAEEFDLRVGAAESRSSKERCPFGFEHDDGGMTKAMRVYPATNSTFCFAGHGFFDPVRLVAKSREWTHTRAAKHLLEARGLLAPMGYRERFAALDRARYEPKPLGNPAYAVEALQMALSAHESHGRLQYHPVFTQGLERALALLSDIMERRPVDPDAALRSWFATASTGLGTLLDRLSDVTPSGVQAAPPTKETHDHA